MLSPRDPNPPTPKTVCLLSSSVTRLQDLTATLRSAGYRTYSLSAPPGAEESRALRPDLLLLDLPSSDDYDPGPSWAEALLRLAEGVERPALLALGSRSDAGLLETAPQFAVTKLLPHSLDRAELLAGVRKALSEVETAAGDALLGSDFVIGGSAAMARLCQEVRLVADRSATVLLTGPTGVGKERVARAIHEIGPRSGRPFVAVNCAGIPAGLLESEFFGHVKGSFTGAHAGRPGRFLQADGGTLFLDEVGELPLELQPKLLRAVQEREITPVGAAQPLRVDVRIIAATNVDLGERVAFGSFRQDLFYRLNVFPIAVPPLRERLEDIPVLAEHFCRACCRQEGLEPKRIGADAIAALIAHPWPGNVRELQNAVESAVIRARGRQEVLPEDFGLAAAGAPLKLGPGRAPDSGGQAAAEPGAFQRLVAAFERSLILNALTRAKGNKTEAARALGLRRTTLVEKLKRLERLAG